MLDTVTISLVVLIGIFVIFFLTFKFVKIIKDRQKAYVSANPTSEHFNSLFEKNPDGVCFVDLQGNFLNTNLVFEQITGYSKRELIGQSFVNLIAPEDRAESWDAFQSVLENQPQNYDIVIIQKGGTRVQTNLISIPVIINNKIEGKFTIIKDISVKKLSEQALQESERRYCLLVDTSPDAIILSRGGEVLYANPATANLINGCNPDRLIGKSIKSMLHPDDLLAVTERLNLVEQQGENLQCLECKLTFPDDRLLFVEMTATPIFFQGKSAVQIIVKDITKRKQTEAKLLKSNHHLLQAKNIGRLGTWEWDLSTNKLYFDHESCRIFNVSPDQEICYEDFLKWVHPEDLDYVINKTKAESEGVSFHVQYKIIHPDGSVRIIEAQSDPDFDETKNVTSVYGIVKDITEQKKTEELLQKIDNLSAQSELAAGVAHEIRNPLNSISGVLQLLQMTSKENASDQQNYIQIMMAELERIDEILGEFLMTASPQDATRKKPTNMIVLLNGLVTLLKSLALKNNVQIQTNLESDLPLFFCIENQIKQVFINIIKNAIEAMPDGGKLLIEATKEDNNKVLFRVIDQGVGIAREDIDQVVTPFFTTKEKGTGLGLTISSKIIEEHGGAIKISSSVNHGTTVEISLPIYVNLEPGVA